MTEAKIRLPLPTLESETSLEFCLAGRRSVRKFAEKNLQTKEVSQLLWAAAGSSNYKRTVPSAGALYPIVIYALWEYDLFRYMPTEHGLDPVNKLSSRQMQLLCDFCLKQDSVYYAPLVIFVTANYESTTKRYGKRAERYVFMEAGHAGQNIALQAVALDLACVMVGSFKDGRIKKLLGMNEYPLYVIPVGRAKSD